MILELAGPKPESSRKPSYEVAARVLHRNSEIRGNILELA